MCDPEGDEPAKLLPGDGIRYRFSGSYTETPVVLEERILSRRGLVLEIEVIAVRGGERRHWVQVVTDTPHNRANNLVDFVYEVLPGGQRVTLANENNRDILRLFEWTYPSVDVQGDHVKDELVEIRLVGERHRCTRSESTLSWKGRQVLAVYHECPDFPWRRGPGHWEEAQTGKILWQVEVVDAWRDGGPARPH